jgi:hypothetical protein
MRVMLAPRLAAGKAHQFQAGERLATLDFRYQARTVRVPVRAAETLSAPSLLYRLTRL